MGVGYAMRRSRRVEMVQEERRNGLNLLSYVVIGGGQVAPFGEPTEFGKKRTLRFSDLS